MLVPIVNDAPWIASVGVATFQFPILDAAAKGFKAPYLCAFDISPIIAGRWRQPNHIAETLSSMACSSYGRPGTLLSANGIMSLVMITATFSMLVA